MLVGWLLCCLVGKLMVDSLGGCLDLVLDLLLVLPAVVCLLSVYYGMFHVVCRFGCILFDWL